MRVAICDDNQQDIERIRRYTLRMIDYAGVCVLYQTGRIIEGMCRCGAKAGYVHS